MRNEGAGFGFFQACPTIKFSQARAIGPFQYYLLGKRTHGTWLTFKSQAAHTRHLMIFFKTQSEVKIFAMFSVCKANLSFFQLDIFFPITVVPKSVLYFTETVLDGFKFQITRSAEARVLHGKLCCLGSAERLSMCARSSWWLQEALQMSRFLRLICSNSGLQMWNVVIYELTTGFCCHSWD